MTFQPFFLEKIQNTIDNNNCHNRNRINVFLKAETIVAPNKTSTIKSLNCAKIPLVQKASLLHLVHLYQIFSLLLLCKSNLHIRIRSFFHFMCAFHTSSSCYRPPDSRHTLLKAYSASSKKCYN